MPWSASRRRHGDAHAVVAPPPRPPVRRRDADLQDVLATQPLLVVAQVGVDLPGIDVLAEVLPDAADRAEHRVVLVVVVVHAVAADRVQ